MIRIHVCIACLVALLGLRLLAQESRGFVSGVVTDASGSVVANAKVVAVHIETNVETATKTNDTGTYTLPYLPPGVYNVTAEMAGFRKRVHENVEVSVGDRLDLNLNRVQFDDPGVKPKNADFGIVSTTTNPTRQVQFAARFVF